MGFNRRLQPMQAGHLRLLAGAMTLSTLAVAVAIAGILVTGLGCGLPEGEAPSPCARRGGFVWGLAWGVPAMFSALAGALAIGRRDARPLRWGAAVVVVVPAALVLAS